MSMVGQTAPTPSELAAFERRKAFRKKIADKAAELHAQKMRGSIDQWIVQVKAAYPQPIKSVPAKTAPKEKHWFCILEETRTPTTPAPSILEIQIEVAKHFKVSVGDICSARRQKYIILPRQIAVYLCKELTPHSLPVLGRHFGGRDHTTQLSSVRKIKSLIATDWVLACHVAEIARAIIGDRRQ